DGKRRIKVRLGDANTGALGSDFALGASHVGSAAHQIRRNADGYLRRYWRNLAGAVEQGANILRRNPHQDAEPVFRLTELRFELRHEGLGLSKVCLRLRHVESARSAGLNFVRRKAQ